MSTMIANNHPIARYQDDYRADLERQARIDRQKPKLPESRSTGNSCPIAAARRVSILKYIEREGGARLYQIQAAFKDSRKTIQNDVTRLRTYGKIRRVGLKYYVVAGE